MERPRRLRTPSAGRTLLDRGAPAAWRPHVQTAAPDRPRHGRPDRAHRVAAAAGTTPGRAGTRRLPRQRARARRPLRERETRDRDVYEEPYGATAVDAAKGSALQGSARRGRPGRKSRPEIGGLYGTRACRGLNAY